MTNKAIDELIKVLNAIGIEVHETRLKIEAMESTLKTSSPDLHSQYQKSLAAYRQANRAHSEALAAGSTFDRLRSALILDQIPQQN